MYCILRTPQCHLPRMEASRVPPPPPSSPAILTAWWTRTHQQQQLICRAVHPNSASWGDAQRSGTTHSDWFTKLIWLLIILRSIALYTCLLAVWFFGERRTNRMFQAHFVIFLKDQVYLSAKKIGQLQTVHLFEDFQLLKLIHSSGRSFKKSALMSPELPPTLLKCQLNRDKAFSQSKERLRVRKRR